MLSSIKIHHQGSVINALSNLHSADFIALARRAKIHAYHAILFSFPTNRASTARKGVTKRGGEQGRDCSATAAAERMRGTAIRCGSGKVERRVDGWTHSAYRFQTISGRGCCSRYAISAASPRTSRPRAKKHPAKVRYLRDFLSAPRLGRER